MLVIRDSQMAILSALRATELVWRSANRPPAAGRLFFQKVVTSLAHPGTVKADSLLTRTIVVIRS